MSRAIKGPPRWLWIAGPVVAIVAVFLAYSATRSDNGRSAGTLGALADDPGVVHVHGLGINPANGDVYAATHMGLFRIPEEGKATRIANRYQDTMGFTVVGPDHFLASGHPDLREDLPPLLGLLETKDGGRTWTKKSLIGEADFHALRYAHGTIFGYDSTGSAFMVSPDGRRWDTRSNTTLRDFVVSPDDADVVVATTPNGLERSDDGGRTWEGTAGPPGAVLMDWQEDALWVLDMTGRVHISADGGATWDDRGKVAPQPQAFLVAGERLYAAVHGGIYVSRDGGRTWEVLYREGDRR